MVPTYGAGRPAVAKAMARQAPTDYDNLLYCYILSLMRRMVSA
jgi:hypothetical protein